MSEYDVEKARVTVEVKGFEEKDIARNKSYAFFLKKIADIAGSMGFEAVVNDEDAELLLNGISVMDAVHFIDRPGEELRIVVGERGSQRSYPPKKNGEYLYNDMAFALMQYATKRIRGRANEEAALTFRDKLNVSERVAVASSDNAKPITIDLTKVESHAMNMMPADAEEVVLVLRKYGFIR